MRTAALLRDQTPAVQKPAPGHLWQAFAHSVRDNVIAELAVQALRLGAMVVLARALRPQDFGLFRVLLVVAVMATLFSEAGIPDALIQRKDLTAAHESTAWWISVALAVFTAAILYLGSPLIAALMAMPELTPGLRLLCIPIMLEGSATTANARLRRRLRFGVLGIADVVAEVAFLAVAFWLLRIGRGAWSLPCGLAARFAAHALAVWIADPHVPLHTPRIAALRDLAPFAVTVWSGRLVYVLSSNIDFLLVGRLLGSSALGFYSVAWDLLKFLPDRLYKVAGRVTFPAFCQLQGDDDALARAYENFFGYLARIILPVAACIAIAAPELLGAIYGQKWVGASVAIRLLAPGLALAGLRVAIGSVYYTKARPSFDLQLHGARTVLIVIAVGALSGTGLAGVCIGMSVVEGAISVIGQWMASWLIGLELSDLLKAGWPGLRLGALCCVSMLAGSVIATALGFTGPARLLFEALPPALVFLWLEATAVRDLVGSAFRLSVFSRGTKLAEEQV